MKKLLYLLAIVCLAIGVFSCEKEPVLTLNTANSLSFSDQGGSQSISFITNKDWTIQSSESWCKVSPSSGEAAETGASISINCDPNTTYDSRNCSITINAGGLTQSITVSQETNLGLIISQSSFNLSSDAQTIEVEVKANVKYTIDIDPSCKDWIKHVSTRALSTNTLVFEVAENNTYDDRIGSITLRQSDGILAETISIIQNPRPICLTADPEIVLLSSKAQKFSIEVQSNVLFYTSIPEDANKWLKLESSEQTSFIPDCLTFSVVDNNTDEIRSCVISFTLRNGTIIGKVEISQNPSDLYTPLTFEAITDGKIIITNQLGLNIEYFKNNSWINSTETLIVIPVLSGEAVSFRGNNDVYTSYTLGTFFQAKNCYIYGNVMSLVNSSDYSSATSVRPMAFYSLFRGCMFENHPSRKLLLPATTLAKECYAYMFSNCDGLTIAPELPATRLAEGCYRYMFSNCDGLTIAPELPATRLASVCYQGMFLECKNLSKAPSLPATTLALGCYDHMFYKCHNLISASNLPATKLQEGCYAYMFYDCTNLEVAPELPALYLENRCYTNMFAGCLKLKHVSAAFLTPPLSNAFDTSNWLGLVASNGTFVKNAAATWNMTGENGIPEGWTVVFKDFPGSDEPGGETPTEPTEPTEPGGAGGETPGEGGEGGETPGEGGE